MIGRYRGIKPSLFQHGDLYDLELSTLVGGGDGGFRSPIRLAFAGLFCWCDREGRFEWKPRELKLNILPYDPVDFADVLDALARGGFVVRYEVGGRSFGWIPTFTKHQNINNREAASDLPAPPPEIIRHVQERAVLGGFHEYGAPSSPPDSREPDASATREPRVTAEGKGSEVKGTEENGDQKHVERVGSVRVDSSAPSQTTSDQTPAQAAQGDPGREISGSSADLAQEPPPASSEAISGEIGNVSDLEPPAASNGAGGKHLAKIDPLPKLPSRATVRAIVERIATVNSEIVSGTRRRLLAGQQRELQAQMAFSYWAMKHNHEKAILVQGDKREKKLIARLKENDGDLGELFYAIDGALKDRAIQGEMNDSGAKYDGIETILRDRAQVERLATLMPKYRNGIIHPMVVKYAEAFSASDPSTDTESNINGNE